MGVGVVDVGVVDPMGRKDSIKPMVARKADDNWYVEYTPLVEGLHSVNIFFAGKPIPHSPYQVFVSHGKGCVDFSQKLRNIISFIYYLLAASCTLSFFIMVNTDTRFPYKAVFSESGDFTTVNVLDVSSLTLLAGEQEGSACISNESTVNGTVNGS